MRYKTIFVFLLSVAVCLVAAKYRPLDSAHTMGTLGLCGGSASHPAIMAMDRDSHMLIATARVVPYFHGNARVVLEGDRGLTATFHNSEPAVSIGLHHRPEFRGDTYRDLHPGDRIALWVGIRRTGPSERVEKPWLEKVATTSKCPRHQQGENRGLTGGTPPQTALAFYDTVTGYTLLRMPIRFVGRGGAGHGR